MSALAVQDRKFAPKKFWKIQTYFRVKTQSGVPRQWLLSTLTGRSIYRGFVTEADIRMGWSDFSCRSTML